MQDYKKILISFLFLVGLFGFNFVYADGIVPCTGTTMCNLCDFWQMGDNIVNFIILYLAIPIGALLFVVAGVTFLVAGGNEQRLALAKTIFLDTLIGLLIVFCSWLLINTIFNSLASGEFSGAWNSFPGCVTSGRR